MLFRSKMNVVLGQNVCTEFMICCVCIYLPIILTVRHDFPKRPQQKNRTRITYSCKYIGQLCSMGLCYTTNNSVLTLEIAVELSPT